MKFDITVKHPSYESFVDSWVLMRDSFEGEDDIKAKGEIYLPTKSGIESISDVAVRKKAYDRYKLRAEFPELVAQTIRGAVGTMLDKAAVIELPPELEVLRESATHDGLTLEALHRRIATEVMLTGRYGLLPGINKNGEPYLAGYVAESIINWDESENGVVNFAVLDESGYVRDPETNAWGKTDKYRELSIEDGKYISRVWEIAGDSWQVTDVSEALDIKQRNIGFLPLVFVGSNDLTPAPDDVPLYGLAKLSVRIYRMDADLTTSLHMTSEPTPVISGYESPIKAIEEGAIPKGIGATTLWVLPEHGDAKFLEFSGQGIQKQEDVIQKNYDRAVMFGAQMLADRGSTQESGEAKKVRMDSQHSALKSIAMNSSAGLERALKNLATWVGANPDDVSVTPNLEFFNQTLTGADIAAIVGGWIEGAYSWQTAFERLKKGDVIPEHRTADEERELMAADSQYLTDWQPEE